MVNSIPSRLTGQHFTPFERGVLAVAIAALMAVSAYLFMYSLLGAQKEKIHAAKQEVLQEDCQVVHQAIDSYTVDRKTSPKSLDDLIQAGYLKALPAGFSLEACK